MNPPKSPAVRSLLSRRTFLKGAFLAGTAIGFPFIRSSAYGDGTARRIRIGMIGCGRMAQSHAQLLSNEPDVMFAALCDVDAVRLESMRQKLTARFPEKAAGIKTFADYTALLADPGVDAVLIATPDHWHALVAIEAALAGKDVYLEKPCTLTIAEGLALVDVASRQKTIVQVGSQQRSMKQFVRACEIIRNGGIGKVSHVQIGLPVDVAGGRTEPMKIPAGLDYDRWLGPAEELFYTEDRVHPQSGLTRPGWLRGDHFCKGMITGWGTHHVDIAHWALDLAHTGPVKISSQAQFLSPGLWDVHGKFQSTLEYSNGIRIDVGSRFAEGIRFEGDGGWLFVSREAVRPPGNPNGRPILQSLDAQDRNILKAAPGPVKLGTGVSHHRNWLDSILSRKEPVAPLDQAHRSCTACQLAYSSMKLGRPVLWDPALQRFSSDAAAAQLMAIPERGNFSIPKTLRHARFEAPDYNLSATA